MGLTGVVSAERVHIGFFGMRNAGKSSVVNKVTSQQLSVVSDVKGTTTDPVQKAMELLPLGPVVIIDTPGIDDIGELGKLRVEKTRQILSKTDIAVLVVDATKGLQQPDFELVKLFDEREIPYITVYNKADLVQERTNLKENEIYLSAINGENVEKFKNKLATIMKSKQNDKQIIADLVGKGDTVVLVIPIDQSAPKGRLILPQQLTLRELLDHNCTVICCQPSELKSTLNGLVKSPKMIVTDSQAFGEVAKDTPKDVMLTSFSILFARYKGDLQTLVSGASKLSKLKDGDTILISEGCTHHRQCNDIGTVKMPKFITKFSKKSLQFEFTSGGEFPDNLSKYALIVHCGGCMINEKEMKHRMSFASDSSVPIVNYGVALAQMNGILKRSLEPFPQIAKML